LSIKACACTPPPSGGEGLAADHSGLMMGSSLFPTTVKPHTIFLRFERINGGFIGDQTHKRSHSLD